MYFNSSRPWNYLFPRVETVHPQEAVLTGMAGGLICRLVHNLRCRVLPRPVRHLLLERAFSRATHTRVLIWTERGCHRFQPGGFSAHIGRSGLDIADAVQGVPSPTEAYLNLNSAHHPRLLPWLWIISWLHFCACVTLGYSIVEP